MDIIIVGMIFLVGVIIGAKLMNLFHQHMIGTILRELGITPQQLDDLQQRVKAEIKGEAKTLPIMQITLEQHQGTLFAYRADTKEFVGQGVDRDSLAQSIAHRFKGVRVEILNGELLSKSHT